MQNANETPAAKPSTPNTNPQLVSQMSRLSDRLNSDPFAIECPADHLVSEVITALERRGFSRALAIGAIASHLPEILAEHIAAECRDEDTRIRLAALRAEKGAAPPEAATNDGLEIPESQVIPAVRDDSLIAGYARLITRLTGDEIIVFSGGKKFLAMPVPPPMPLNGRLEDSDRFNAERLNVPPPPTPPVDEPDSPERLSDCPAPRQPLSASDQLERDIKLLRP